MKPVRQIKEYRRRESCKFLWPGRLCARCERWKNDSRDLAPFIRRNDINFRRRQFYRRQTCLWWLIFFFFLFALADRFAAVFLDGRTIPWRTNHDGGLFLSIETVACRCTTIKRLTTIQFDYWKVNVASFDSTCKKDELTDIFDYSRIFSLFCVSFCLTFNIDIAMGICDHTSSRVQIKRLLYALALKSPETLFIFNIQYLSVTIVTYWNVTRM